MQWDSLANRRRFEQGMEERKLEEVQGTNREWRKLRRGWCWGGTAAAEQGDASAQYNLGGCYKRGQGVTKDEAEAARWYRKAAEQGDAIAQHKLGVCYERGQGVAKDQSKAVRWYRKAAEQGNASAQEALAKRGVK